MNCRWYQAYDRLINETVMADEVTNDGAVRLLAK